MTRIVKFGLLLKGIGSVLEIFPTQARRPLYQGRKSGCGSLRKDWQAICGDGQRIAQDLSRVVGR